MNQSVSSNRDWSGEASARQESPVESASSRLHDRLANLSSIICEVEDRLGRALRPQPPQTENKAGIAEAPQSDLHGSIMHAADLVEARIGHLRNLLQRLTL